MTRLRIVRTDDDPDENYASRPRAALTVDVAELRMLVNDPIALIDRARALLDGTAEALI